MANGRGSGRRKKIDEDRDGGGFVALPWVVLDSPAYASLSHPARALLLEFARQCRNNPDNNGRLIATGAYLAGRGWHSADVITRAKRELLDGGFIYETVKGRRPNVASWYAVTWRRLYPHEKFDPGAAAGFVRSAYMLSGNSYFSTPPGGAGKNRSLTPSDGVAAPSVAPSHGVGTVLPTPSHGAIGAPIRGPSTPSGGIHLENPSAAAGIGSH